MKIIYLARKKDADIEQIHADSVESLGHSFFTPVNTTLNTVRKVVNGDFNANINGTYREYHYYANSDGYAIICNRALNNQQLIRLKQLLIYDDCALSELLEDPSLLTQKNELQCA